MSDLTSRVDAPTPQGLCAVCAHTEASHVGCGADCDQCPGETSCEECMRADWYGSSDLHFFEAQ